MSQSERAVLAPQALIYLSEGQLLELRAPHPGMARDVVEAVEDSKPSLKKFMSWAHGVNSEAQQLERSRMLIGKYWAGEDYTFRAYNAENVLVALGGLHFRDANNRKTLETGYWVRLAYQGQGIATLMTKIMVTFAFEWLGMHRVQITHNVTNQASQRVVEKVGFQREGIIRNLLEEPTAQQLAEGLTPSRDGIMYAMLPKDYYAQSWRSEILAGLSAINVYGERVSIQGGNG